MNLKTCGKKMSGDLRGAKIVVTRPALAAKSITETLVQLGAQVICMPLFAVEGLVSAENLLKLAQGLNSYDLVICISRNALDLVLPYVAEVDAINWATVGPETAKYLQIKGASNVISPLQPPFDSNSLLLQLQLTAKTLKNQCIMILTGADGNNALAEALQYQGARVEVAALYKRTMPEMSSLQLQTELNTVPAIDIMVVTCVTSLANLQALAASAGVNPFGIPLLVVSPRISAYALEKGFVSVRIAKGMSDANIVAALLAWRNNASE
jgi:uroporphyrinogen III methyltransferase/synthase